jgi:hypothetical protein
LLFPESIDHFAHPGSSLPGVGLFFPLGSFGDEPLV